MFECRGSPVFISGTGTPYDHYFESSKIFKENKLSRCSDQFPSEFKIGTPTPGNPNDCSGQNFILYKKLVEKVPENPTTHINVIPFDDTYSIHQANTESDGQFSCTAPKISRSEIYEIRATEMNALVEEASHGESGSLPEASSNMEAERQSLAG